VSLGGRRRGCREKGNVKTEKKIEKNPEFFIFFFSFSFFFFRIHHAPLQGPALER
jgi:hypothetical protein